MAAVRGHTMTDLASDTGIAMSTLIRLNRGGYIAGPTLRKIRSWMNEHPADPNLIQLLGPAIPLRELTPPEGEEDDDGDQDEDDQAPAPACQ